MRVGCSIRTGVGSAETKSTIKIIDRNQNAGLLGKISREWKETGNVV
jgi:hypothetical protein